MGTKNQSIAMVSTPLASSFVPRDKASQRILQRRAKLLAKVVTIKHANEVIPYIRFRLGRERYGIPYKYIQEVIDNISLTVLPHVPGFVNGVINRHGDLIPIIDLKAFFNIPGPEVDKHIYIIVTALNMTIGMQVDEIEDSDRYDPTKLNMLVIPENVIKPSYIIGLHKSKIAILNVEAVISDSKIQMR